MPWEFITGFAAGMVIGLIVPAMISMWIWRDF